MGICMVLKSLSDEKIGILMADPPLVWRVVAAEEVDLYLNEIGQTHPPDIIDKLLGVERQWPPEIPDFVYAEDEGHEVDLDKSWDGINFCLKKCLGKSDCPNLFEDGRPIGNVEVGSGPALCFTSDQVVCIADEYEGISENELLAGYEPVEMIGVYPEELWRSGDEGCREYLAENFTALKRFLAVAKEHRLGVLIEFTQDPSRGTYETGSGQEGAGGDITDKL